MKKKKKKKFEVRDPIPEEQLLRESMPPFMLDRPEGPFLPPSQHGGHPWAPCICQLCSCGRHSCPDVTPIPPSTSEYLDKFDDKPYEEPVIVHPKKNNWWPEGNPEDLRLQTMYRRNYRDWKMRPNIFSKKELYVEPYAEFKTPSEYQGKYKFPHPLEELAVKYEDQPESNFLKLKGPLKSTYGWDYDDFPVAWKKVGMPRPARLTQNKIWHKPFTMGYKTRRPFNEISTYIHDYVWFDEFGVAHPYPAPDPWATPESIPAHFAPLPLSKLDYVHWKDAKPPESWKPNFPYSPPPFPLVKKTTYNTTYRDWSHCGPEGVGREKVPIVCMECSHEIKVPPEWISNYMMDFHEHYPLWFCKNIECFLKRANDPCRDVVKEKCMVLCDEDAAATEFANQKPPPSAFDPNNPFRPKEQAPVGPDPIRDLVYQPCDPFTKRKIPCTAAVILAGMRMAKPIGRTSCPESGHVYVCPDSVDEMMKAELNVCKRFPFRTWSKGDLDMEVEKFEKFKLMEATGGTRK